MIDFTQVTRKYGTLNRVVRGYVESVHEPLGLPPDTANNYISYRYLQGKKYGLAARKTWTKLESLLIEKNRSCGTTIGDPSMF